MPTDRPPMPRAWVPLALGAALCLGAYLGRGLGTGTTAWEFAEPRFLPSGQVLSSVLDRIDRMYVDPVDRNRLTDIAIDAILDELDPHSDWFSAEELAAMAEPMEGNFEGIGVEFLLQEDTIMVVTPIVGGPSEAAGIRSGDRIVSVDDSVIAGTGLSNSKVMRLLKGPSGTEVGLGLLRPGASDTALIDVTLRRGRIPIHSVVAAERMPDGTGYIKVIRFARNTHEEFDAALSSLLEAGVERFVLDLRGNGGGYLHAAVPMVERFLDEGDLVVYTEGAAQPRREYVTERPGLLRDLPLVVMVDEGSASASEILAGALQDHDRAVIVGRRTFGKGLVQEEFPVADRGALRLTVARYYTPSGRSIQRPYGDGVDYEDEWIARQERGEYVEADSILRVDSLAYRTEAGRTVYGGGGIAPDVFVPLDTGSFPVSFRELVYAGRLREHAFELGTDRRKAFLALGTVTDFLDAVESGLDLGVDPLIDESYRPDEERVRSRELTRQRIAERIAHNLWGESAGHRAALRADGEWQAALAAFDDMESLRTPAAN
ncbi:MAG: S41 family peptidase [Bacteroidota bacterium]|nr:S41 family peptidase [Bacteroidota bacterium]